MSFGSAINIGMLVLLLLPLAISCVIAGGLGRNWTAGVWGVLGPIGWHFASMEAQTGTLVDIRDEARAAARAAHVQREDVSQVLDMLRVELEARRAERDRAFARSQGIG